MAPDAQGAGLGRAIVEALLEEARERDLDMVFAFTYELKFFARLGFAPIARELVPWKAWKDCAACPKQDCCDETAVAYWLKPSPGAPVFRILQ
ncbi:MAG: GNAT family N-acetyltransferase [Acidobacteria bacterium]|nr:GNAT family N-acetyltransferase [Acidobacteriota bacterium]